MAEYEVSTIKKGNKGLTLSDFVKFKVRRLEHINRARILINNDEYIQLILNDDPLFPEDDYTLQEIAHLNYIELINRL